MKKIIKNSIFLILIFITISGCSKKEEKSEKIRASGKCFVRTRKAKIKDIARTLTYSGIIYADAAVDIAPDLSMKIIKFYVDEGDYVNKNQLLAEMDTTKLMQARIQYDNVKKNYKRMLALKKSGTIDLQQFEQIEAGYKQAKFAYEYMLENTEIRAPFDGIITSKTKNAGEFYISMMPGVTGSPSLLRLVNLDRLKVKISIPDVDLNKIEEKQKVIITVNSEKGKKFYGIVNFISQEADAMSGTFPCHIKIENTEHILKPNQFAEVKIIIEESENAVVLPQSAVVDTHFVFVIKLNQAYKRKVEKGIQNENEVEIKNGVKAGMLVVTEGNVGLKNMAKIEIRN